MICLANENRFIGNKDWQEGGNEKNINDWKNIGEKKNERKNKYQDKNKVQ